MIAASYVPGTWTGLVCGRLTALVGPGAPRSQVAALWDVAGTGGGVHDALVALGEEAELPAFALVTLTRTGLLHAALRGDAEVSVGETSGVRELRAEPDAPWTEVTGHDVPAVTLRAPTGDAAGSSAWMPSGRARSCGARSRWRRSFAIRRTFGRSPPGADSLQ